MKTIINFSNLFKTGLLFLFFLAVLSSCEKNDTEKGGATIIFKATIDNPGTASTKSFSNDHNNELNNGLIIESFKINIEEIELEFDDDDPLFENDSVASDIELEGPFEIDLMLEGNTLETVLANNVELPAAVYDELEFEFDKSENSLSDLLEKSILVEGTLNGTPFIFWHDDSFEVEIEFEHDVHLDEAKQAVITVTFDMVSMFNPEMGGIDISNAKDANENGLIEIYPEDPDGNENLADRLMDRLDDIMEAFEDQYDD